MDISCSLLVASNAASGDCRVPLSLFWRIAEGCDSFALHARGPVQEMYLRNSMRFMRREREIMEARRREQMRQRHLLIRAQEEAAQMARAAMIRPLKGPSDTSPPSRTTHFTQVVVVW